MGASFQANLRLIRGETANLRAWQKVLTDRQTAFRLYIVDNNKAKANKSENGWKVYH